MKIMVISNYYPPLFEGGYELSIAENMRHLTKRGHEIHVLCGVAGPFIAVFLMNRSENWIQRKLPLLTDWHEPNARIANHGLNANNYDLTQKAIEQIAPDIIYMGNQKRLTIGCALAAQHSGIPLIYDMGDDWLKLYTPHSFKQRLLARLNFHTPRKLRDTLKLNPVICPSQWFAEALKHRYRVERSYVIPRLIDTVPANERKTALPLSFVFAGRIEPLKGLQHIIEIAPQLLAQAPDFRLDIYGDDSEAYADTLKAQIHSLDLGECFRFKGKSQELKKDLPRYDVLIMPTLAQETFGRIIIEAMAARLIVIASDQYGPAEIIDSPKDSLLFKRNNPESLLEAILSLYRLTPKEIDALKDSAFQKVKTKFSPELHIPHLEEILTQEIKLQTAKIRG